MRDIPQSLLGRPFHRREALVLGVTPRMLQGDRFVRLLPEVYAVRGLELTEQDRVAAAALALPDEARTTGLTRIRQLGLDEGPEDPLHFVISGDLHLDLPGIFLHRTVLMPPVDDVGVTPAAAFLAYCVGARVLDAIAVGDWLLHRDHLDLGELADLTSGQPWRDGAAEAAWVSAYLDGDARSLPEGRLRPLLGFAGLPTPEVNQPVDPSGELPYLPDLYYRRWRTGVEYEGRQHQADRDVYGGDIERYAALRRAGIRYVQVTAEKMREPRRVVHEVYRELVAAGYDGPAPDLGPGWSLLFGRLSDVPGLRRQHRRSA